MNNRFRNLVYGLAFAIMVGFILRIGKPIFIPIISGIISVYVLSTMATSLGKVPIVGSVIPLWLRHIVALLAFIFLGFLLVVLFAENIQQVIALAPQYQATLLGFVGEIARMLGIDDEPSWGTIRSAVLGQLDLQRVISTTVTSVSALGGQVFVVFLYASFLMAERLHFSEKIVKAATTKGDAARIMEIVGSVNERIGNYLTVKTLINVMLGLISYACMRLIGVDFAGFFAVLIGVLNYIPYVGSIVGVAFPVLLTAAQFGSIEAIVIVLISLTASQVFIGGFVEPRLLGRSMNLSPFVVLISLTVWYALWGIGGAILAVPMTSVVVIVLAEFRPTRPIAILLSQNGDFDRNTQPGELPAK
ncbi:AI-2E family transporter [Hoeflea prorocentri]|uniref:AI-2E family transporter n=1 Tax=Hoeflea prorocentri TaxID=1922333 RepID=A0A9X3UGR0_9HYPH|nr:AI-2E family transporter [Hoeflea prorocentri]MCY6381002.1 AI-2E family transporter [Hoeflea prorocentri]MDA5398802.1 AI-2E family transporter [Hoeflea prorocentri]